MGIFLRIIYRVGLAYSKLKSQETKILSHLSEGGEQHYFETKNMKLELLFMKFLVLR